MILVLAATFQVKLIDAPILQVVTEGQDAHLVDQMKLSSPVEVEDRTERLGMSVEEVLIIDERVIITQLGDGFVGVAFSEPAKTSMR